MSSLLPIRSDASPGQQDPRVVDLEGEEADEVFGALSSKTARRIVTELHEEPRTQSDLADDVDTTVQNVRYHLDKLDDAGLVEVVDTWYSSRGNEMKVYAPADGALIVSGDRGRASRLKTALSRLVGGVSVIGLASLLVQVVARRLGTPVSFAGSGGADDGGQFEPTGAENASGDGEPTVEDYQGKDGGDGGGDGFDAGSGETVDGATTARDAAETTTPTAETGAATDTAQPTGTTDPTATETVTATDSPLAVETPTPDETTTMTDGGVETTTTAVNLAREGSQPAADVAATGGIPPGLLFFLGGVSVLVVLVGVWYVSGT